ncbi:hypothetical protein E2C01_032203 [Portunus trituberculatus]|uniref:Uncharacterized protein n=1 Tax=Portunus trituberculatus TaxID=210409 RepID=A0A5B7EWW8_PORTR|nr:hypothetical protein [Portunus trituberculatus]
MVAPSPPPASRCYFFIAIFGL